MELIKSLKNLGLNEKEARVYVALVQLGQATAYSVAKHSGLKKPTTYVILDDLIDQGVVTKVSREKVARYIAISPEDLFATYKSRLKTAEESALPELMALVRGKKEKIRANYYEGIDAVNNTLKKIIGKNRGGRLICLYSLKQIPAKWLDRVAGIKKFLSSQNIQFQEIISYEVKSNVLVYIFKNYTYFITLDNEQGIIIEHQDIAQVMKEILSLADKDKQKRPDEPPKGPTRVV